MLTFGRSNITQRLIASGNDIRRVFRENRAELEWLAYFITGNRALAVNCVTDACALSEAHTSVFTGWLSTWARHATIRCAIDGQRERIRQISSNYCQPGFIRQVYERLMGESLEFVVEESDTFIDKLDVVCRVTLVICGVQGKSIADAALMLGISLGGVQAAYSTAMNLVEATRYHHLMHHNNGPVVCNRA